MTVQIVRFTTRPEQEEVKGAVIELFSAIGQAQPSGICYLARRQPD